MPFLIVWKLKISVFQINNACRWRTHFQEISLKVSLRKEVSVNVSLTGGPNFTCSGVIALLVDILKAMFVQHPSIFSQMANFPDVSWNPGYIPLALFNNQFANHLPPPPCWLAGVDYWLPGQLVCLKPVHTLCESLWYKQYFVFCLLPTRTIRPGASAQKSGSFERTFERGQVFFKYFKIWALILKIAQKKSPRADRSYKISHIKGVRVDRSV